MRKLYILEESNGIIMQHYICELDHLSTDDYGSSFFYDENCVIVAKVSKETNFVIKWESINT